MCQPTIMLSSRLASLLGLGNPDCGAFSMMWENYEVCITANQHASLSIMSTDNLRAVVGPAHTIVVEGISVTHCWRICINAIVCNKITD